ncbi:MAG: hypothetical protein R3346_03385 [Candidatus Spechtbacterales bacterium]|nr:hypothetical protein [Candidatus Spechtbacterales bacterium]
MKYLRILVVLFLVTTLVYGCSVPITDSGNTDVVTLPEAESKQEPIAEPEPEKEVVGVEEETEEDSKAPSPIESPKNTEPSPEPEPELKPEPEPTEEPKPSPNPEPPKTLDLNIEFTLGSGITPEVQTTVFEVLTDAATFVDKETGYHIKNFEVFLFKDRNELVDAWMRFHNLSMNHRDEVLDSWFKYTARAGNGFIFFLIPDYLLDDIKSKPTSFIDVLTHEYVHVIQYSYAGTDNSPKWLNEGISSYISAMYLINLPMHHPDMDWWLRDAKRASEPLTSPLKSMESRAGIENAGQSFRVYLFSALAAHQLAENSGMSALLDYYKNLENSVNWRVAFRNTFDVTADEFYIEFENLRIQE